MPINFFLQVIIFSDEPTHFISKGSNNCLKAKYHLWQLCLTSYTAVHIENCLKSTSVTKENIMKTQMEPHALANGATPINYCLKSEVFITLLCQLGSTQYKQQYESRTILLSK